jgi:hypothetical protein
VPEYSKNSERDFHSAPNMARQGTGKFNPDFVDAQWTIDKDFQLRVAYKNEKTGKTGAKHFGQAINLGISAKQRVNGEPNQTVYKIETKQGKFLILRPAHMGQMTTFGVAYPMAKELRSIRVLEKDPGEESSKLIHIT